MAIQVTKRGVKPEEKRYKGTCSNCKSEMVALGGDIIVWKNSGYQDNYEKYGSIKCPICDYEVYMLPIKNR